MDNFTVQICPKCKSKKFKTINEDLSIVCICGELFNAKELDYITGKQAQLLLEITTRQGLKKIVDNNSIEVKSQGAGKPNLYLKSDIENYIKTNKKNIDKYKNNATKEKVLKKEKVIKEKKVIRKKNLENKTPPKIETPEQYKLDAEDFNPLNSIGQAEFLRVEKLVKANGTYEDMDQSLLLFYSISYQKYINAVTKSEQQDDLTSNEAGDLKIHPYFTVAKTCLSDMHKLAKDMGIGVRNRLNLDIKKKKEKSMFDTLVADNKDFED